MVMVSKPVGNPRGDIIDVLGRTTFPKKLTGKKVGVNGNEGDMAAKVPSQLSLWLTPYISSRAVLARSEKDNSVVVSPIMDALPPEEIPVN